MLKHNDNSMLSVVMDYVIIVARFYEKALGLGSLTLNTADEYVVKYESDYCLIDQYYRLSMETIIASNQLVNCLRQYKKLRLNSIKITVSYVIV